MRKMSSAKRVDNLVGKEDNVGYGNRLVEAVSKNRLENGVEKHL
jgi:hypothetical protein